MTTAAGSGLWKNKNNKRYNCAYYPEQEKQHDGHF